MFRMISKLFRRKKPKKNEGEFPSNIYEMSPNSKDSSSDEKEPHRTTALIYLIKFLLLIVAGVFIYKLFRNNFAKPKNFWQKDRLAERKSLDSGSAAFNYKMGELIPLDFKHVFDAKYKNDSILVLGGYEHHAGINYCINYNGILGQEYIYDLDKADIKTDGKQIVFVNCSTEIGCGRCDIANAVLEILPDKKIYAIPYVNVTYIPSSGETVFRYFGFYDFLNLKLSASVLTDIHKVNKYDLSCAHSTSGTILCAYHVSYDGIYYIYRGMIVNSTTTTFKKFLISNATYANYKNYIFAKSSGDYRFMSPLSQGGFYGGLNLNTETLDYQVVKKGETIVVNPVPNTEEMRNFLGFELPDGEAYVFNNCNQNYNYDRLTLRCLRNMTFINGNGTWVNEDIREGTLNSVEFDAILTKKNIVVGFAAMRGNSFSYHIRFFNPITCLSSSDAVPIELDHYSNVGNQPYIKLIPLQNSSSFAMIIKDEKGGNFISLWIDKEQNQLTLQVPWGWIIIGVGAVTTLTPLMIALITIPLFLTLSSLSRQTKDSRNNTCGGSEYLIHLKEIFSEKLKIISPKDFQIIKTIAKRENAEIIKVNWQGSLAALKILSHIFEKEAQDQFEKETAHMLELRHPNIIKIYGGVIDKYYGILMELAGEGSLRDLLKKRGEKINLDDKLKILLSIARAVLYAHEKKILHRDIKPSNILVGKDFNISKLADFGSAVREDKQGDLTEKTGTFQYMSPKYYSKTERKFKPKDDLYSMMVTFKEVFDSKTPFAEIANKDLDQIPRKIFLGMMPPLQFSEKTTPKSFKNEFDRDLDPKQKPHEIKEIKVFLEKESTKKEFVKWGKLWQERLPKIKGDKSNKGILPEENNVKNHNLIK